MQEESKAKFHAAAAAARHRPWQRFDPREMDPATDRHSKALCFHEVFFLLRPGVFALGGRLKSVDWRKEWAGKTKWRICRKRQNRRLIMVRNSAWQRQPEAVANPAVQSYLWTVGAHKAG